MKKYCIFTHLLLIVFIMSGCGEDPPRQASQNIPKQQTAPVTAPPPQPVQAEDANDGAWPFNTEDTQEVELADNLTAQNYILIFDGSGSMGESNCAGGRRKIEVAKDAVSEWSKSIPSEAYLGLVAFHRDGWSTLPLTTGNRETFINAIDQINSGRGTPLSQALGKAYKIFTTQGRRQLGYGEYTFVVVTDGIADNRNRLSQNVNYVLSKTPIQIHSIGFCIGKHHSLNQPGHTIYKSADNPEQLREGLKEVLAESEAFDDASFD